ncbi:translation initiation factor IF-2-like [Falco naumanni]|uniref:translation initiation factor IF-2-like n=1 Tax=Falco naumanni TaxID=148594 RepID=UPI001ADEAA8B|nr:translation initiation factor IF-2-like [Falco naumanni]
MNLATRSAASLWGRLQATATSKTRGSCGEAVEASAPGHARLPPAARPSRPSLAITKCPCFTPRPHCHFTHLLRLQPVLGTRAPQQLSLPLGSRAGCVGQIASGKVAAGQRQPPAAGPSSRRLREPQAASGAESIRAGAQPSRAEPSGPHAPASPGGPAPPPALTPHQAPTPSADAITLPSPCFRPRTNHGPPGACRHTAPANGEEPR